MLSESILSDSDHRCFVLDDGKFSQKNQHWTSEFNWREGEDAIPLVAESQCKNRENDIKDRAIRMMSPFRFAAECKAFPSV